MSLVSSQLDTPKRIELSGFSDEAAWDKKSDQQFAAFSALGLKNLCLRFVDVGNGVKNAMQLNNSEIETCRQQLQRYDLQVSSLGSPIGKVKLLDVDDGTSNRYVPFEQYLQTEVKHACELANRLDTKLIRGFSFYHPRGTQAEDHVAQVADQLGQIADLCASHGLIFGLEVEANLVGKTGQMLATLHSAVNRDNLLTIFDGANLSTQGFTAAEIFEQYLAMKPGLGWMHIKDYKHPGPIHHLDVIDEEALKYFVPADQGDCGHEQILCDFADYLPTVRQRLNKLGVEDVYLDLEPHVRGGGQFGGFSGPDGFGIALRGLCRVLDYAHIDYSLRDYSDLKAK